MAKIKKPIVIDRADDKAISEAMDALDGMNPEASMSDSAALSDVAGWIDTGNYSLNAICSGSCKKGIPIGRLTGLVGPPSSGKTMIALKILSHASEMGMYPVIFDSEQAVDRLVAERMGCVKFKHAPIELIEDCKNQIICVLEKLITTGAKRKIAICIDSVGMLSTRKELSDALENKSPMDMGMRAKILKSMMTKLTYRAAKAEVPILFTNHIYDNPGEMYPSAIKKQSGGYAPLYIASLLIQLSNTNIKAKDDVGFKNDLSGSISGINLKAFITKNRFVPAYLSTEMYLNFKTGLDRYSGLLDLATKAGYIKLNGTTYSLGDKKLGYAKTFELDPEFWENGPLDELNKILEKEFTYSTEEKKKEEIAVEE